MNSRTLTLALAGLLLPCGLAAQGARDSSVPRFESLLADPQMTAIGARVLWLDESDSELDDHVQGEAILGENLPIVSLARGPKPVSLGLGGSVTARFGLTAHDNPMVAADWRIQVNVNHLRGPWIFVAALWHESNHLGDEYVDLFGQDMRGGAREGLTAWAFYRTGDWRLGASATGAFRIVGNGSRFGLSGGADFIPPRRGGGLVPRAGVFVDVEDHSGAQVAMSARLGFAVPVASGAEATISLAGYSGPSTLGYFRDNDLRYLGIEVRLDL